MRTTLLVLALLFAGATVHPARAQQPQTLTIFQLKNADAEKLRPIVVNLFGRQGVSAVVDGRTNSLLVAGDKDTLEEVRKVIEKLDEPAKPK